MKIKCLGDNKFIVYLNCLYYKFDKSTIEGILSKILKRLKKVYDLEVFSTFNIECYVNNNYGIILEINREYDPFNLYGKKTDINIKFHDNALFLYEIDDYFIDGKKYIYKGKIYIDTIDINSILEHVNSIIYGDMVLRIVK